MACTYCTTLKINASKWAGQEWQFASKVPFTYILVYPTNRCFSLISISVWITWKRTINLHWTYLYSFALISNQDFISNILSFCFWFSAPLLPPPTSLHLVQPPREEGDDSSSMMSSDSGDGRFVEMQDMSATLRDSPKWLVSLSARGSSLNKMLAYITPTWVMFAFQEEERHWPNLLCNFAPFFK